MISEQDIEFYRQNGAVVLRNVLSKHEIMVLEHGIDSNLSNPGPLAAVASDDCDPGKFLEDFCNWKRFQQFQEIIFHSKLPQIAAKLMGSTTVRFYHDHLLVKEPKTRQATPYHQDQPYYNISGFQNISFWIPVDHIPKESSLNLVAGSHRDRQWYLPRTFCTNEAKWFPEGSLPDIPDTFCETDILSWQLDPGDVIAFHMLTIHGSQGSMARRRVTTLRYVGDDTRLARRSWRTSPEFPNLELQDGAVLDHELFPIVYDENNHRKE